MLSIIQQTVDETTGLTPQDTICTLEETLGNIDKLTYRIYPDSRAYGKAQPRVTAVWGIDKQLDEEAFRGRVSRIEGKSSGTTAQTVTCESAAARLKDGIVSVSVSRSEILQNALTRILQAHREITDEDSHVYLGDCPETIVQETQDLDFVTTLEAIETVCADAGLEWRVRYDDASGHYLLDVSELFGTLSETVISVGKNLGSIRYTVDPSQLATRLIPLGGIGYNGQRLTIRTVGGRDSIFIDRPDLIEKYGVICRKIVYDDIAVDDPQYFGERAAELYRHGVEDSNSLTEPAVTWEVSAIELARAGYAPDIFRVGNFYRIIHPMLGADVTLRLVGKKTDYRNPQRSSLTFGDRAATLTSSLAGAVTQVTARQTAQIINITQMIDSRLDGLRLLAMSEVDYNALQTKQSDVLYIATTSNDFTLYYGTLPLRSGGGPVVDENQALVNAVWASETGSDIPTLAKLVDTPTNPSATYWLAFTGVGWWAALVPYDASTDYKKIKAKIRFATTYSNQGLYKYSDLTPPGIVPNASYNSKYLQFAENETDPIKFKVGNLSNMSACHPEISSRYTFTDGGWYDYQPDEYNFYELITLSGLTSSSHLMIVKFYNGTVYAFTYPNGVTPAITDDGTRFVVENIASRATISTLLGGEYTAKATPTYEIGKGFNMGRDAVSSVIMASTFDLVCDGVTIFAKNADITDFVAT